VAAARRDLKHGEDVAPEPGHGLDRQHERRKKLFADDTPMMKLDW
jgi:hypothetical protein